MLSTLKRKISELYVKFFKQKISRIVYRLIEEDFKLAGYMYFLSVRDAQEWGYKRYGHWVEKLREEERQYYRSFSTNEDKLLRSNQLALQYYCGYRHEEVNNLLRFEEKDALEKLCLEIITRIDSEFQTVKVDENIIVVRWMCEKKFVKIFGSCTVGSEIIDSGFMSTSLHLNYNSGYEHGERKIEHETLLIIKIPSGHPCLYVGQISGRDHEQEVLLPRGTELIVERIFKFFFQRKIFLCSVKRQS